MFGLPPLPRTLAAALADVADSRRSVREAAVRDLSRLATSGPEASRARAELERLVVEGVQPDVRGEASLALADSGGAESVQALCRAASDENVRVREMALIALGELVQPPDDSAGSAAHAVMDTVASALASRHAELRFQALLVAGRLYDDAQLSAILVQNFAGADPLIRHRAVRIVEERWLDVELRRPLPAELRGLLVDALGDADVRVRVAAVLAASKVPEGEVPRVRLDEVVLEALVAPGLEPEDEEAAIELAGRWRVGQAASRLRRKAWGIVPGRFAWQARIALAMLGDSKARRFLLRGLSAWSRESRTLAAVAVGRAGMAEARPLLEEMLQNPSRADREAVEQSLRSLADRDG